VSLSRQPVRYRRAVLPAYDFPLTSAVDEKFVIQPFIGSDSRANTSNDVLDGPFETIQYQLPVGGEPLAATLSIIGCCREPELRRPVTLDGLDEDIVSRG